MTPLLLGLLACSPTPTEPPMPAAAPLTDREYWVERSDAELDAALAQACKDATAHNEPVLLAFSAPWCIDCKKVRALEQEAPLSDELHHWTKLVINVGRMDRHPALLASFEVSAIAHWAALQPDCAQPVTAWKRLRTGTFEPASNPSGVRTSADLAAWLVTARTP